MTETYLYVTFSTTADAIACEKACRLGNIVGRLVAAPRQLSAGCGLAWRCSLRDKAAMQEIILQQDLSVEKIVDIH